MKIMGVDPGTARTGYGIIKLQATKPCLPAGRYKLQACGCIETPPNQPLEDRLATIYQKICAIIKKEKPQVVAVEQIYFFKNAKTALSVGHARGVILLAARRAKKQIFEYTPLQVKDAVVGYGRADKNQIGQMVKLELHLKDVPRPDDVSDALAVAICCAASMKMEKVR